MSNQVCVLTPSRDQSSTSGPSSAPPWESPQWQEAVRQNPSLKPFFDNLESFVELPGGVNKLREMILRLAVRGQLLTSHPDDSYAVELVAQIREQREQLIAMKKIRRGKQLSALNSSEYLFPIPRAWEWVRFGELGDWGAGSTPRRGDTRYYNGNIVWLKSGELNNGIVTDSEEKVTQAAMDDCSLRLNQPGDVLIAMYGATIGKLAIAGVECTTNQAVCACTCFDGVFNEYLFLLLKAFKSHFIKNSAGAAQPNYSKEKIVRTAAPLPPLAEQRRIVSKVEGLMSLCDALEDYRRERESVRERASRSVLASLTTAPRVGGQVNGQETLASSWQRLSDHFEVLLDQPETIPQLRQSILQLAVQGKLVPQDPSDEPATVDSLGNLLRENSLNGYSKKPSDTPEGVQVLRISAGTSRSDFYVEETGHKWAVLSDREREKFNLQPDDLLACRFNGNLHYVGKFSLYRNELGTEQIYPDKLIRFRVDLEKLLPRYAVYALNAESSRQKIESFCATTAGNIGISATNLKTIEILVPPLAEQKRIVSKVSVLLSQCDELATRLRSRQSTTDALLAAIPGERPSIDFLRV